MYPATQICLHHPAEIVGIEAFCLPSPCGRPNRPASSVVHRFGQYRSSSCSPPSPAWNWKGRGRPTPGRKFAWLFNRVLLLFLSCGLALMNPFRLASQLLLKSRRVKDSSAVLALLLVLPWYGHSQAGEVVAAVSLAFRPCFHPEPLFAYLPHLVPVPYHP